MIDRQYLLGDNFSAADIMMGYTITLMEFLMLPQHTFVANYLARLKERDGFHAAFGKLPTH
ncbi:MAG: hypothetical protein AAF541_08915 [Pseudomonadota bacterium]